MATSIRTLQIRSSPHIHSGTSVDTIMFHVVLALMPACVFAIYHFGLSALMVLSTAVLTSVLTEHLVCLANRRPTTVGDWSVTITGLLYGMTLPPSLPLWMVAVGGVFAVGVGKMLFGGLGSNVFNPALVGRAFLQAAFPVAMTSWPALPENRFAVIAESTFALPLTRPAYPPPIDGISSATPLAAWKSERILASTDDLFFGFIGGSVGETSALLLLVGGAYLVARNMMNWRITAAILVSAFILSGSLHLASPVRFAPPLFTLCGGGLMIGAVFMATDMVASPITHQGAILYGVLIGSLVVIIRSWGGMPEGMMYAILIGNAVSPLIDRMIQPRVFGTRLKGQPHAT